MDGKRIQMLTNCLAACTHLSSNSFPAIRTASAKNRYFHVPLPTFLLSRVTTLTRDIDRPIANLSVHNVPVSDENSLTYRHSFFTIRWPNHSSFTSIKHPHEIPTESLPAGALNTGGIKNSRFSTNKSL